MFLRLGWETGLNAERYSGYCNTSSLNSEPFTFVLGGIGPDLSLSPLRGTPLSAPFPSSTGAALVLSPRRSRLTVAAWPVRLPTTACNSRATTLSPRHRSLASTASHLRLRSLGRGANLLAVAALPAWLPTSACKSWVVALLSSSAKPSWCGPSLPSAKLGLRCSSSPPLNIGPCRFSPRRRSPTSAAPLLHLQILSSATPLLAGKARPDGPAPLAGQLLSSSLSMTSYT